MLTTTRLRLLATIGVAIGLLGGAATGIYLAAAADSPKSSPNQPVKSQEALVPVATPEKNGAAVVIAEPSVDSGPLTKPLKKLKLDGDNAVVLNELFAIIEDETDLVVRVDVAAFRRIGLPDTEQSVELFLKIFSQARVFLPRHVERMPLRDVLGDALAQIFIQNMAQTVTYQVRGTQLVIIPSYQVPNTPGADPLNPQVQPGSDDDQTLLPARTLYEQIYGGVVSVNADKKPLTEILTDLRKQTGANIVYDNRCETAGKGGEKKASITIALNDVRLYDALRVIADLAELKMVYAGNIYYVTTPENAKAFQPPPVVRPIVYSTSPWGFGGGGGFQQPIPANNSVPANNPPPASDPKKP